MNYVNVKKSDEFTPNDRYGRFIVMVKQQELEIVRDQFFEDISNYLSTSLDIEINIDWVKETTCLKKNIFKSKNNTKITYDYQYKKKSALAIEVDELNKNYNKIFKRSELQ
jgi:hypothetical protein